MFVCNDDGDNSSPGNHTDTLLRLLNEDLSGEGEKIGQEQRTNTTMLPPSHDFDLYRASCSDAATRSSERCVAMIAQLDPTLQSHLLDQFWDRFNAVIPLVHKEAFLASLETPTLTHSKSHSDAGCGVIGGPFCSPELHLAILATGVSRADHHHTRGPDIARLLLPGGWESSLHRQLRDTIDSLPTVVGQQQQWSSVCQVQATAILAQLELESGRDHSARLYLDLALQKIEELQSTQTLLDLHISDDELVIQRMTLRAVRFIHSIWTVFDHGPGLDFHASGSGCHTVHLPATKHLRSSTFTSKPNDLNSQVYNAHLDLMGIADVAQNHAIPESMVSNHRKRHSGNNVILQDKGMAFPLLTHLHGRLKYWYANLPTHLKLDKAAPGRHSATPSLFLLHQQYHSLNILLFRPVNSPKSLRSPVYDTDSVLARHKLFASISNLVLNSAIQICNLLSEMMERFELGAIPPPTVQQAALAASSLLTSIPHIEDPSMHKLASSQLDVLQRFFSSMADINAPAERLARSLQAQRNPRDATGVSPIRDCPNIHTPCTFDVSAAFPDIAPNVCNHQGGASLNSNEAMLDQHVVHHYHPDIMISESPYYSEGNNSLCMEHPSADVTGLVDSPHGRPGFGTILASSASGGEKQNSNSSQGRVDVNLGYKSATPISSHSLPRIVSALTPPQIERPLPSEDSHMEHFHSLSPKDDQTMLPVDGATSDGWDDGDAVRVSWSETFKALGAVNRRTAGEKMSANEFGDVMGCVFQL
ncbi:uncharacterized protein PV06_08596 [Exophiala oligosperma]|uniref:Transcription factor domain-containing protein n=1 Tax=Exophiala oligosperma TaxID=215243 RepID=A0A0D2AIW6_9EURO|nr:uncharacterized protein PV06_08596 [Exophiala oligosperma]KIW40041.1 hypothetical protein PV06_08596 [Exophiala oligosperma]